MVRPDLENLPEIYVPDGFELRPIRPEEAEQWGELCAGRLHMECDFAVNIAGREGYVADGNFVIVDKLQEDKIVATAAAFCPQGQPDGFCHIEYVAANAGYAGRGLGRAVTLAALHRLRKGGMAMARLGTWDFCLAAIKLYLELGFLPDLAVDDTMPGRWDSIYAALGKKIVYQDNLEGLVQRAQQGDVDEQYRLGEVYWEEKNFDQAIEWTQKAAEQGHSLAQFDLYFYYCEAREDPIQGAAWLKKAAEQGYSHAQAHLAWIYYSGEGVERSLQQSALWYEKASQQGIIYAQVYLGNIYRDGDGLPQDYTKAMYWYKKAAEHVNISNCEDDVRQARYNLGLMYYGGYGADRDFLQAAKWFKKAAEIGDENARKMLHMLKQI